MREEKKLREPYRLYDFGCDAARAAHRIHSHLVMRCVCVSAVHVWWKCRALSLVGSGVRGQEGCARSIYTYNVCKEVYIIVFRFGIEWRCEKGYIVIPFTVPVARLSHICAKRKGPNPQSLSGFALFVWPELDLLNIVSLFVFDHRDRRPDPNHHTHTTQTHTLYIGIHFGARTVNESLRQQIKLMILSK